MIKSIMKNIIFIFLVFICLNTVSQVTPSSEKYNKHFHLKLNNIKQNSYPEINLKLHKGKGIDITNSGKVTKSKIESIYYIFYSLLLINPMLVIEDKKAYFGLTKEVSIGYYPTGRLAFEYSYLFREMNKSHLRFSYNYDIVLETRDFAAFTLTPGAGYFTDTHNKGWFGHLSAGMLVPAGLLTVNPYFRYRHTFLQDKPAGKTDIDDISIGMGFIFFLNGL